MQPFLVRRKMSTAELSWCCAVFAQEALSGNGSVATGVWAYSEVGHARVALVIIPDYCGRRCGFAGIG